ncbi:MAG: protein kinase [Planctomycetes bacterium]|nr:protein kinase [Planctomycetota bacterium]
MSPIDPDDQPTRHGGPDPGNPPPEERTVPFRGTNAGKDGKPLPGKPSAPQPPDAGAPASVPAAAGPAKAPAGPVDPFVGKTLGGCRLDKMLGRGAMGAVYKARQLKLDRDVAVKVIRPEMMTDQRMLKRFEVEARTVGKFNSANVVMVHDVGFELGVHYLVMEFVQGKNLRDHVKLLAGGRLPVGEALPLLRQAIKGLEEAQRLQVVHRDIKPDNLMITDRGVLKIADFGIAKPLQEDFSMTLTSELVGTPLYMSPEQCQGEPDLDFRSDMYSLGATFYYLLTGEPPIRASSVYELIATKTKLANLCLWKALPGLDENNPLSRVIERMTALGREDRYDSYEELLNDLVLVEQGATITLKKRAAGGVGPGAARKPVAKAAKAAKPGRGAVLAAIGLMLAAGGGGWLWWQSQQAKEPVVGGTVDANGNGGATVSATLPELRARLRSEGPTAALQRQIAELDLPAEQRVDRDRLVAAIGSSLAMQQALAAIARPTDLALPFDDLKQHCALVAAAARQAEECGPDLVDWRDRTVAAARAEGELSALALARLATTFSQWQDALQKAGNDAALRADLGERLRVIESARTALHDLVPNLRDRLRTDLPVELLDKARRALAAEPTTGPLVDVDVAGVLATVQSQFAGEGPTEALRDRVQNLAPTRRDQVEARALLLNTIETARLAREQALGLKAQQYPDPPKPPFDDVTDYWQAIDRALQPVRTPDGQLPAWALALRGELRAEAALQTATVAACAASFTRWQQAKGKGAEAAAAVQALRTTRERAVARFAAARDAIEAAIPEAALATAEAEVARTGQREQWHADAEQLSRRLVGVATLAEWTALADEAGQSLQALREAAKAHSGDAEVAGTLQRLGAAKERWSAAVQRLQQLDGHFGKGELAAAAALATTGAAGNEARAEFLAAGEVLAQCTAAFDALGKTLGVDAALTALGAARTRLRAVPMFAAGGKKLDGWIAALEQLRAVVAGLVPIPGGRTKGGATVAPFFLSATEVSKAEFAAFVAELRAAAGEGDPQQRFGRVADRLPGCAMSPERLAELLAKDVKAERTPVDNLTWHAAAAFAAWHGRALPTAAEWSLAAFGDGGKFRFPWGEEWSNESDKRNPSNQSLAEVDAGGLSWRTTEGVKLHHLAGNVAEWLAADAGATTAQLAGGRYNDTSETKAREQAEGKLLDSDKSDARRGFGCRVVLRVQGFPGLDWPR